MEYWILGRSFYKGCWGWKKWELMKSSTQKTWQSEFIMWNSLIGPTETLVTFQRIFDLIQLCRFESDSPQKGYLYTMRKTIWVQDKVVFRLWLSFYLFLLVFQALPNNCTRMQNESEHSHFYFLWVQIVCFMPEHWTHLLQKKKSLGVLHRNPSL